MEDTNIDLLYTLYFISRKVKNHYRIKNADVLLTVSILHILMQKASTLSKLSEKVYSKISSLSEKISEMELEGLVMKSSTEKDERETVISITGKGREYIVAMQEKMKTYCTEFTKKMSEEEIRQAAFLMKKLLI